MALPRSDVALLLRRSGFVARRADIDRLVPMTWPQAVDDVLDTSRAPDALDGAPNIRGTFGINYVSYQRMVWFWANRAAFGPAPIVEKMTLFWHGLLTTSLDKVYNHALLMDQNTLYRRAGTGSIPALYQQTMVGPAMLNYLDNAANVAGGPNENFARELLELFLLGVGHYSEQEVRIVARAWTGHGVQGAWDDVNQRYRFDATKHDATPASFRGATRSWDGPEILAYMFTHGPTRTQIARFLGAKLWAFFAYPNPEPAAIDGVADALVQSNFEVIPALRVIFNDPRFRSQRSRSGVVRAPFEFMVAAMAHTDYHAPDPNLAVSRNATVDHLCHPEWYGEAMGQALFRPPNVSGWRENRYWVSSSAVWGKSRFVEQIQWKHSTATDYMAQLIAQHTPSDAARAALAYVGVYEPLSGTVQVLANYLSDPNINQANHRWVRPKGLLFLALMSPDFQMA